MKFELKKNLLWILTFMPLVITLIALNYLPETTPAHYNFSGEIDRWGSKYEILILPIMTMIICGIYTLVERKSKENNKSLGIGVLCIAITFNIITYVIIGTSFKVVGGDESFNVSQILIIASGIIFIIVGNYMPKLKRNHIIGIRTKWTLESEEVWYKTHRLGGKVMVITGVLMGILALIFKRMTVLPVLVMITVPLLFLCIYSYKISEK
ncbi:SdpI family protein [Clostridium gasigenes]|uniref:SdpI family protein n=1 Tax=Clostridium gasigenes TaxID=94869 RepID=UPI0014384A29|nr:SdpI family protein [Clostridium gasigenes]NKF08032.1 DUF1648 domain-containing protein [Clostridium gasigenes]QSW20592.1 SdpI family protein [Clostridium gasigenes]